MSAETLLNHLHKVRKHQGHWMACCPAHDDKSPSLSITEGDDGHILIYCFAGCSAQEIMGAVGLEMGELFPEKNAHSFDDQPPMTPERLSRNEEEIANLEFRVMVYTRMLKGGTRFSDEETVARERDYRRLAFLKKGLTLV